MDRLAFGRAMVLCGNGCGDRGRHRQGHAHRRHEEGCYLAEWWGEIRHYYADRILSLDIETAQETGRLMDRARAVGIDPGFEDIAIAATGKMNGLTVLTRNTKDFAGLA